MNRLRESSQQLWNFLYPPFGLKRLGPRIEPETENVSPTDFYSRRSKASEVQQSHLAAAEAIYKGEQERKKTIEDKAGNFFAGAALSSSILIALPTLLAEKVGGPLWGKMVVLAVFMLAVAYLIGAAIYATKVRAAGAYCVVNAASLTSFVLSNSDFRRKWASHLIDLTRRNQFTLLQKTNQLYVAEQMFLRGLALAGIAGFLLGIFAIAYPPIQSRAPSSSDSPGTQEDAVLATSLSKCLHSNADLSMQLSTEGRVIGELKAELAASLKAQAKLKAELDARLKSPKQHPAARPRTSSPKSSPQRCDPAQDSSPK